MAGKSDPETIRQAAYREFFQTRAGQIVLDDLVMFAQTPTMGDSRSLGRADVVLRIHRETARSNEPAPTRRKPEEDV